MLGLIYHVFRSLPLCMGVHLGWNFAQGTVYGIPVSGAQIEGWLVSTRIGPDWLTGGSFGAEASVVTMGLSLLCSLALLAMALRGQTLVSAQLRCRQPKRYEPRTRDNAWTGSHRRPTMLIDFFYTLRSAKLPVSVKEYLVLLEAIKEGVVGPNSEDGYKIDDFYYLSRAALVKDEKHYDKFDRAFAAYFKGVEMVADFTQDIPLEWLRKNLELELSPEEKAKIEKMGWDELMETLKKRFEEQKERHEGGSKMIGTGGTSPFGAYGFNPQGIRIGQDKGRNRSAVKVWDQRAYKDYDDSQELGTRNIKIALRRLRKFAREGSEEELDLDDTIRSTAANAGYLDIKMVPERHNNVKILLLMDVGGTMDEHIHRVEEMFSAAKTEFKHLEFYYFHNCVYDFMWKNNRRRFSEKFPTWDIIRKYNKDYKLIFVGDATMSPYEILQPGGSVEYNNEEAGAEWLQRLTNAFPKFSWINPEPQGRLAVPAEHQRDPATDEPPHVPADHQGPGRGHAAAFEVGVPQQSAALRAVESPLRAWRREAGREVPTGRPERRRRQAFTMPCLRRRSSMDRTSAS